LSGSRADGSCVRTREPRGTRPLESRGLLPETRTQRFADRAAGCLDKTDANKLLAKIRRQWFAKRKSIMAILKEVMTNEASVLMDSDASATDRPR
jgi:hypothetical protein